MALTVGNVVKLKGSQIIATVESLDTVNVSVAWFEDSCLHRRTLLQTEVVFINNLNSTQQ